MKIILKIIHVNENDMSYIRQYSSTVKGSENFKIVV